MGDLNKYTENVAARVSQFRGGAVQGNLTGRTGAQPGNNKTAAGGQQVIKTSSDIDGVSELANAKATVATPTDPEATVSGNKSVESENLPEGKKDAFLGGAGVDTANQNSTNMGYAGLGSDILR